MRTLARGDIFCMMIRSKPKNSKQQKSKQLKNKEKEF